MDDRGDLFAGRVWLRAVMNSDVTSIGKLVASAMFLDMDRYLYTHTGNNSLAETLRINKRTVRKGMMSLTDKGWLHRTQPRHNATMDSVGVYPLRPTAGGHRPVNQSPPRNGPK